MTCVAMRLQAKGPPDAGERRVVLNVNQFASLADAKATIEALADGGLISQSVPTP